MKCPYCGSTDSKVVDKRDNDEEGFTRRRRECLTCFKRFTTYERIENVELDVEKRDGRIEKFSREKLKKSILKSVGKTGRPIGGEKIQEEQVVGIVEDIEMKLLNRKSTVIRSTDIGKMVLNRLKKLDMVAYMRFASIYKELNSIEDYENEFKLLKKWHHDQCKKRKTD